MVAGVGFWLSDYFTEYVFSNVACPQVLRQHAVAKAVPADALSWSIVGERVRGAR